ncbi:MAG: hypothetical protein ACKO22_02215 [Cyanobium sp.]
MGEPLVALVVAAGEEAPSPRGRQISQQGFGVGMVPGVALERLVPKGIERIDGGHVDAAGPQPGRKGAGSTGTVEHPGALPAGQLLLEVEHRQRLLAQAAEITTPSNSIAFPPPAAHPDGRGRRRLEGG